MIVSRISQWIISVAYFSSEMWWISINTNARTLDRCHYGRNELTNGTNTIAPLNIYWLIKPVVCRIGWYSIPSILPRCGYSLSGQLSHPLWRNTRRCVQVAHCALGVVAVDARLFYDDVGIGGGLLWRWIWQTRPEKGTWQTSPSRWRQAMPLLWYEKADCCSYPKLLREYIWSVHTWMPPPACILIFNGCMFRGNVGVIFHRY